MHSTVNICILFVVFGSFGSIGHAKPQEPELTTFETLAQQTDQSSEIPIRLNDADGTQTNSVCGKPNVVGLNKHGLEFLSSSLSKAGEFPWTVAIMKRLTGTRTLLYAGGGSLIHPSVVLTAVHEQYSSENAIVRVGEWDFNNEFEEHPYQDRTIANVHVLDVFDLKSMQLIFVSEPFILTPNIQTVCLPLPGTSIAERDDCITAAWGQQSCSGMKGLHSIQGHTELSVWSDRSVCEAEWQQYLEDKEFSLKNHYFCTNRKNIREESCFCDHGAALFCATQSTSDSRYEQIGVALATGGCKRELPGIYANVALYRQAIDNLFDQERLDKSYYIE